MKRLQRMSAGVLLACLLAVSVSAGDMSAGYVPPPPPPAPSRATSEQVEPTVTTDETSGDVVEVLKTLLH
jgi:hypothetical protein